ncbi:M1 family metallopeptidase [Polyangium mundeleinium]|uniref:M1 family metallopeptidase n=1 Tax=Polyangium mundeleinium TaxID=2995306 RepID=A0ABT5EYI6_9BACT|nr:M1 family metallopeptidase [Polyangium mundeleinium]MDC0745870.1 M1 family metallopeptidase [Polyangium mundeleinium]
MNQRQGGRGGWGRTALAIAVGLGATYGAALAATASVSAEPPAAAGVELAEAVIPPSSAGSGALPAFAAEPMAAHADPVASYTLRATLDPTLHQVRGEGTIVWRNASHIPQREIWLHLYLNAFKNEKTNYMRQRARGFRGGGALADYGWIRVSKLFARELDSELWDKADRHTPGDPDDETDIRVPLPRAIEPGETLTLDVAFVSDLPSVTLRTGFAESFHMVAQWFPKLAKIEPDGRWAHFPFYRFSEFYADYGNYDVTIDAPEGFVIGATGRLDKETAKGGRIERRFLQEDVHDFAFTAWDHFREVTATTADGVALRCLYPPGFDRVATIELDAVRFGLEHFGAAYGKYPYGTVTIVHPPRGAGEAGGMEYPTLITTGGAWWTPETGARAIEGVTLHELGHQWFYGLVATNEHAFPFLDEGLNTYAEGESMEARWPGNSALRLPGGFGVALPSAYRVAAAEVEHNDAVAQSAARFASGSDYGSLVYSRTATILNTLAGVYGPDRVREAIGRYTRRYRFRHPGPEELLGILRDTLGPDAELAARQAIFERGWVDYSVAEISSNRMEPLGGLFGDPQSPSAAPVLDTYGYRGRVLVRRRGTLVFPVDIDLVMEDGSTKRVRWEGKGVTHEVDYEGERRLVGAIIDPEHRVLLDDDLLNNAQNERGGGVGSRVLERGMFGAELLLWLLAP